MRIYASDKERATARRVRFYAQGLNSQGKPYQRHPNFVNHADCPGARDQQKRAKRKRKLATNTASYHRRRKVFRAKGLRVDGKPFRRHQKFHAWLQLRTGDFPL
jgi:hypothetical protein